MRSRDTSHWQDEGLDKVPRVSSAMLASGPSHPRPSGAIRHRPASLCSHGPSQGCQKPVFPRAPWHDGTMGNKTQKHLFKPRQQSAAAAGQPSCPQPCPTGSPRPGPEGDSAGLCLCACVCCRSSYQKLVFVFRFLQTLSIISHGCGACWGKAQPAGQTVLVHV